MTDLTTHSTTDLATLTSALDAVLPQTQCQRCGEPDCASYAQAVANGAPINRCPPGGAEGIVRLSQITKRPILPLDTECGYEGPLTVAVIDENWCIGCTLCIKACPTDAIAGAHKFMHTVIEPWCTGCELCIPVCPVDCIDLEPVSGEKTAWNAWSIEQAQTAKQRYTARNARIARQSDARAIEHAHEREEKLDNWREHTQLNSPEQVNRKRAMIEAAMAKAKARQRP